MKSFKFKEDSRYAQCSKEMKLVIGYAIVNLIVVIGLAMGVGLNKPASEVNIIMGFPDWFFWSGIVGSLIMIILAFAMVKIFFKDMSLESEEE
ncbi:putative membrane protein YhdT [Bacillus pakistanensis]|uniref:Membrane protein YhdT n=1 Tax=Rossellomorea pakistanensis TaxID=992288 RepID=A0ABS2NHG2_9BACI|nr:YhdT family protein [Bacillus pakistanensis]MBM7587302.1 putative membrane protein YhdT [Bacillus pakistanensis]